MLHAHEETRTGVRGGCLYIVRRLRQAIKLLVTMKWCKSCGQVLRDCSISVLERSSNALRAHVCQVPPPTHYGQATGEFQRFEG